MTDLLVLTVMVFTLGVLFILTMLNVLHQHKNKAEAAWNELDKQLIIRRDTIPCLLESARIKDPRWDNLKNMRTELLNNQIDKSHRLELELKLGNAIEALIATANEYENIHKDTVFLEASKDLKRDTAVEIKKAYDKWLVYSGEYNDKRKKFPYIVAAKLMR
ncbi:MAG: LemA family protein [Candidatus Gracilibacteria bacterium]|jgi:hypothetical protein